MKTALRHQTEFYFSTMGRESERRPAYQKVALLKEWIKKFELAELRDLAFPEMLMLFSDHSTMIVMIAVS